MRRVFGLVRFVAAVFLILVFAAVVRPAFTMPIRAAAGTTSIAELKQLNLDGQQQWILMRGQDVTAPVLLWLHGGPGTTDMTFAHRYMRQLEEHFVVVTWDQLGAGKSYYNQSIDPGLLTLDRLQSDTLELTDYLDIDSIGTRYSWQVTPSAAIWRRDLLNKSQTSSMHWLGSAC